MGQEVHGVTDQVEQDMFDRGHSDHLTPSVLKYPIYSSNWLIKTSFDDPESFFFIFGSKNSHFTVLCIG